MEEKNYEAEYKECEKGLNENMRSGEIFRNQAGRIERQQEEEGIGLRERVGKCVLTGLAVLTLAGGSIYMHNEYIKNRKEQIQVKEMDKKFNAEYRGEIEDIRFYPEGTINLKDDSFPCMLEILVEDITPVNADKECTLFSSRKTAFRYIGEEALGMKEQMEELYGDEYGGKTIQWKGLTLDMDEIPN